MKTETMEVNKNELYINLGNAQKLTYTIQEVAEILNISVAHAYKLASHNEIPTIRLGKRIVVSVKKLQEFINQ